MRAEKRKRNLTFYDFDDSDDETAVGAGKAVEGAVAMVPDVTMPSKRARLAALDSDSD